MSDVSLDEVNRFLLRKQHLADDSKTDDVIRIVNDICGLHATGAKEPYLALFARSKNFVKEQLDEELHVKKTLCKIRCMRGTLYILTREMLPVAHAATREFVEKLSRRYAEFGGISKEEYHEISSSILALLEGRELTVNELKKGLHSRLNLSALLNLMCDQGLLVRIQSKDTWKAANYRYALFGNYFEDIDLTRYGEDEAIALLVQKYLRSFGPSTEADIAWWTGLTRAKVRKALDSIKDQIARIYVSSLDGSFIALRSDLDLLSGLEYSEKPVVNLLPMLDPYLMGYKQRQRYLDYENYDMIFDRSGNATSTILVNGRVVGVWDFSDGSSLKVFLFKDLSEDILRQMYTRAREMAKFMSGKAAEVARVSSIVPLRERTAGAFMSPLKLTIHSDEVRIT